jgi:hypothetical protein
MLLRVKSTWPAIPLTRSAYLPKRDDFRNFLSSEECAEMVQMVADLV